MKFYILFKFTRQFCLLLKINFNSNHYAAILFCAKSIRLRMIEEF